MENLLKRLVSRLLLQQTEEFCRSLNLLPLEVMIKCLCPEAYKPREIAGYSPGTVLSRGNSRLFTLDATSVEGANDIYLSHVKSFRTSSIANCLRCI